MFTIFPKSAKFFKSSKSTFDSPTLGNNRKFVDIVSLNNFNL